MEEEERFVEALPRTDQAMLARITPETQSAAWPTLHPTVKNTREIADVKGSQRKNATGT